MLHDYFCGRLLEYAAKRNSSSGFSGFAIGAWTPLTAFGSRAWLCVDVSADGLLILAGIAGALYRSENSGMTVATVATANGLGWRDISISNTDQQKAICVASSNKPYYSSDYGLSFTQSTTGNFGGLCCDLSGSYALVVNGNPGSLNACSSVNFGINWGAFTKSTVAKTGCAVASNGYMLLTMNKLLTVNKGSGWLDINTSVYWQQPVITPSGSKAIAVAGTTSAILVCSNVASGSWATPTSPLSDYKGCGISDDGGLLLAYRYNDIRISSNFGLTWTAINHASLSSIADCAISGNGQYLVAVPTSGYPYIYRFF